MKCLGKCLALVALMTVALSAQAEQLFMVRSTQPFPEAMNLLQSALTEHGYTIARVQRVDLGLTGNGFKTDKYRVVFFGNDAEIKRLTAKHPELIPYLPLKIAIFAENDETLLLASSFEHLRPFYNSPALRNRFDGWEKVIRQILEDVRKAQ